MTTLEQIRRRALSRVEFVTGSGGDGYVSRDELTDYVNEAGRELHGELVTQYGEDFFTGPSPTEFTIASGNTYELPSDCLKHQLIERQEGADWVACKRENWNGVSSAWSSSRSRYFQQVPSYRLAGNTLVFFPESQALGTYRVWYARSWTDMSGSADSLPRQMEPWAEFLVVDSAIKCRDKEQSDVAVLAQQKAQVLQRVKNESPNRDMGEVETLASTNEEYDW